MGKEENKGFWEIVFGEFGNTAATHINKRLLEVTPRAIDWFIDWLIRNGTQKYNDIKLNFIDANAKQLSRSMDANPDITKLDIAIEKYKSNLNDNEARNELIKTIGVEISDNYLLWEAFYFFEQEVTCPHCNNIITTNWHDYVLGESSSERDMGTEIIYSIECDEFQCPECKELFAVEGFICTYPDGIYDSHKLNASVM